MGGVFRIKRAEINQLFISLRINLKKKKVELNEYVFS